jgi:hypothetical protein
VTTTILAAGVVEGIPSSLVVGYITIKFNRMGSDVGDICTIIFILAASAINEIHIIHSLGNIIQLLNYSDLVCQGHTIIFSEAYNNLIIQWE